MPAPITPYSRRKDVFTRQFYLDQTKKTASRTGIEESTYSPPDNFMIRGQIPEGCTNLLIKPYEPVIISGEHWLDIDNTSEHTHFKAVRCYHRSEINYPQTEQEIEDEEDPIPILPRSWGVALQPISNEQAGRILIAGVTWLDTSSINTVIPGATHLNIIGQTLVQGYNGRACILQEMKKPHCLIELSNHRTQLMGKTKGTALNTGAEGEVWYRRPISSGWEVTDITIKAWTDVTNIPANTLVRLDPIEGRYVAVKLC